MRVIKKAFKFIIFSCLVLYGIAYAGGPVGSISSLDPFIKDKLKVGLANLGFPSKYNDSSIAIAMMDFIYRYEDRLRIHPNKLPKHRLVDVAFCLMDMLNEENLYGYSKLRGMCRDFVKNSTNYPIRSR